ncbi:MAG: archaellin/type IV pilin N-terminal domain-containing protein [Halobacteriaceae archaeon]
MFETEDRGQVGIGTLIVFIAMVLVAAIAAGVLINTAGFLQSQSEQTGEQSSQQVTNRLQVVSSTGAVTGSDTIDTINMTVKKAPGAEDINLENVTIQVIGPDGTTTLVAGSNARSGVDGTTTAVFNTSSIKDADSSAPVLNDPDDRLEVGIELQQPGASALAELEEGETVTLTITTASGGTSEVRLQAPESLSDESAVEL